MKREYHPYRNQLAKTLKLIGSEGSVFNLPWGLRWWKSLTTANSNRCFGKKSNTLIDKSSLEMKSYLKIIIYCIILRTTQTVRHPWTFKGSHWTPWSSSTWPLWFSIWSRWFGYCVFLCCQGYWCSWWTDTWFRWFNFALSWLFNFWWRSSAWSGNLEKQNVVKLNGMLTRKKIRNYAKILIPLKGSLRPTST